MLGGPWPKPLLVWLYIDGNDCLSPAYFMPEAVELYAHYHLICLIWASLTPNPRHLATIPLTRVEPCFSGHGLGRGGIVQKGFSFFFFFLLPEV